MLLDSYFDIEKLKEWATFSYDNRYAPDRTVYPAGFAVTDGKVRLTAEEHKWLGKARRSLLSRGAAQQINI